MRRDDQGQVTLLIIGFASILLMAIVVVIDVSHSMSAKDVEPDRLSAAKKAATEFILTLPGAILQAVGPTRDGAAHHDASHGRASHDPVASADGQPTDGPSVDTRTTDRPEQQWHRS